jgi:rhomboid protease GluP
MKKKIGLLFAPFLLVAIFFAGLYSFLHWLLIIKMPVFPLKKDVLEFCLPFILAWIPALLWLRPRIKLLNLKRKRGDLPFLYLIVAVLAIAAPALVAQQYIVTATSKLTALQAPGQIAGQQATKYFTLQRHFADKAHSRVFKSVDVSGRNDEYFNMHIYIALPLLADSADTMSRVCSNWIGHEYHKQISNHQTQDEKKYAMNIFLRDAKTDFDYTDLDQFVYLDRIGNSDAHAGFDEAIKKSPWGGGGSNAIFTAVDAPFAARNGNKLAWIFGALGIGSALWLIMIMLPKFDEAELARWEHRRPADGEKPNS